MQKAASSAAARCFGRSRTAGRFDAQDSCRTGQRQRAHPETLAVRRYGAFSSTGRGDTDFRRDIYVIGVDGKSVTRITTDEANGNEPSWSPDGRYIAFSSDRGDNRDIYVIGVDGKDERQITTDDALDSRPSWSPDG